MANLFPVFEMPQMTPEVKTTVKNQNVTAHYFDFEHGDFRIDGAGKTVTASPVDTWKQWCVKAVATERYDFRAYSAAYGAEMVPLEIYNEKKAKESWIERTVTETLLADPLQRTAYAKDFVFAWESDNGTVTFTVCGQDGMEATLYAQL